MKNRLEKIHSLPYYVQLKNILKEKINSGKMQSNRLPPIRQLAKDFGVSINTVLRAYNELRKDGFVSGAVGRGTFVSSTSKQLEKENQKGFLNKIIELAVEEAMSLQISLQEFEQAVKVYIREKIEMMHNIRLVFIECNIEQLIYFTNHLDLDPQIKRVPVLLDNLIDKKEEVLNEIEKSDIIVTSFYHLNDVKDLVRESGKPIIGINLEPEVRTIVEIAKIPAESTVGIVTTSKTFIEIIKQIFDELNLHFNQIIESHIKSDKDIPQLVQKCDAILVSPRRKKQVETCVKDYKKVIEFVFTPDRTSNNNLKMAILDLKKNRI